MARFLFNGHDRSGIRGGADDLPSRCFFELIESMFDWQLITASVLVAWAVWFLARRVASLSAVNSGCGSNSCEQCPAHATSPESFIPLDSLTRCDIGSQDSQPDELPDS